ncbi:MAG: FAD-dependent oxidoreductase [Alkalicoccus sp.]|nr:MAG: FAD-dependent oxidoreductase [Alkalicoccus sp.]
MKRELPLRASSLWREKELQSFPALDKDVDAEVCVIGGGIAGVTTAFVLARRGFRTALIDAGQMGGGATGYTTAKVTSQHGAGYASILDTFGEDKAALYYDAQEDAIAWTERMCRKLDIDCGFERRPAILYAETEEGSRLLDKEAEAYQKLGLDGKLTEKHELPFPVKKALMMHDQAQFHPVCFLAKLLRYLEVENMPVYEHTRAVDIKRGERPEVITENGHTITADHVVMATHYPFKDLYSLYAARLHVERSYVVAVELNEKVPRGMYLNAESPKRSMRQTPGPGGRDFLLIGGEGHTSGQKTDTMENYQRLLDYAARHFNVRGAHYRWSAQDISTLDGLPYIGPMTPGKKDVYIATGFAKWGMTGGIAAAHVIADGIQGRRNPYASLFTPSRFSPGQDMKNAVKENMDVARSFVKGKLDRGHRKNPEDLSPGEGSVIQFKGSRAGAYRDEAGRLTIVDTTCTHLGCELAWNNGESSWDCPCHGSRFDPDGKVLEGPALKPLKKLSEEE